MFHSVARSLPNPPGRPERENTACLTFGQSPKSELRRRAARFFFTHLVNTRDRTQTRRCGPLSDSATATFRHFSQCSQVREHAKSGQPEGLLTRDRTELYLTFSWKKQSKALRQLEIWHPSSSCVIKTPDVRGPARARLLPRAARGETR